MNTCDTSYCWRYQNFSYRELSDCTHIQSDTDSKHGGCTANRMKLNTRTNKTRLLTFTRKTWAINFNYILCDKCETHTDAVRNLGVLLDSKYFVPSPTVSLTYSFSAIDYYCYTMPYLDPSQYIPRLFGITLWLLMPTSCRTSNGSLRAPCFSRFFIHVPYTYIHALQLLKLYTLQVRTHLSKLYDFAGSKLCSFLIHNISLRVPSRNIRNFACFLLHAKLALPLDVQQP